MNKVSFWAREKKAFRESHLCDSRASVGPGTERGRARLIHLAHLLGEG